jgi:hypothetical protein
MIRRVLVLALTLGITGSPLAVTLCQVLCAQASASAPPQHSCHSEPPTAQATVTAVPHACGHGDRAAQGIEEGIVQSAAQVVAIVPAVMLPVPAAHVRAALPRFFELPPPGPPPPITQLRV